MRQRKKSLRSFLLIAASIISLAGFISLITLFPPDYQVHLFIFQFSIISVFFSLLFFTLFTGGTVVFKSKTQGLLIALFVAGYLLFRLNNFTHPFFFILLASLFLTLGLLFTYRK